MSGPTAVCSANPRNETLGDGVKPNNIHKTEARAQIDFTKSRPVQDRELLTATDGRGHVITETKPLKDRAAAICKTIGNENCGMDHWKETKGNKWTGKWNRTYDVAAYARIVTDSLKPPSSQYQRTLSNVGRLFSSNRISTAEVAELVKLAIDTDKVTAFREKAHETFLKHGLFYYDYYPFEGAVMCFMPQKGKD